MRRRILGEDGVTVVHLALQLTLRSMWCPSWFHTLIILGMFCQKRNAFQAISVHSVNYCSHMFI